MLHSDKFHGNQGLDLHIRTTIQDYFSYIEMAALRVGSSILEVRKESLLLDGIEHKTEDLPLVFGDEDHEYVLVQVDEGKKNRVTYQLDLGQSSSVVFKFYKQYLTISMNGNAVDFGDSVGLLGDYETGDMIGRNGQLVDTAEQFGYEWQVQPDEPKLFQDERSPQLPYEECRMPTAARPARKLRGADLVLHGQAQEACSGQIGNNFDLCVGDVMATGDIGLAYVW